METGDRPSAELLRVSAVLGNMSDGDWPAKLGASRIDVLHLGAAEAQRSRLRKRTAGGMDVAIGLERGVQLCDGDVLHWDEAERTALVARVDLGEVLVIDLSSLLEEPVETLLSRCVEVGHAVGNQHWPAVVKASQVYVPLTVSQEAMEAVMEAHRIEGVSWWFARGADVLPDLAPHEARLLFAGGAGGESHLSAGPGDEATK
jgi:urease accessory protein